MSPDTVSSLFPDRPIRPLPKHRIRERLSPELADSIAYPPLTQGLLPLFRYPPYSLKNENTPYNLDAAESLRAARVHNTPQPSVTQRKGSSTDGERDFPQSRSAVVSRSRPENLSRSSRESSVRYNQTLQVESRVTQAQHSASSSVDGYDSFENTNNKKKRKIPSAGDLSVNGSHGLSTETNVIALATNPATPSNEAPHGSERSHNGSSGYTTLKGYVGNNQGFSGPGRGRLGHSRNGRSPLRTLSDGNNVWSVRGAKAGSLQWPPEESSGIISSAIANAEKLPPQGQENVSLLEQQPFYLKSTPASAQFTFTCDSQVPGIVQWPAGSMSHQDLHQQSDEMTPTAEVAPTLRDDAPSSTPAQSRRRARRRFEKELVSAARQRKQIATDNFYRNSPKPEQIWICEFCEYERIFGKPPRVLIRDYEIKARRQCQEEAERKRLLEKAKAKSRKSKKPGKASIKGTSSGHTHDEHHASELLDNHDAVPIHEGHGHSTQSEEDFENELGELEDNSLPERNKPPSEELSDAAQHLAET